MKDVPKAIEAVWKIESTRLIAAIARVTEADAVLFDVIPLPLAHRGPGEYQKVGLEGLWLLCALLPSLFSTIASKGIRK